MINQLNAPFRFGVLALALAGGLAAGRAGAATVSVAPSDTTVSSGDHFTVAVTLDSVADLKGFKLIFSYNSAHVHLTSVSPGEVLTASGRDFAAFRVNEYASPIDSVWYEAAMLDGNASGPGVLAYFSFTSDAVGATDIACQTVLLRDSDNQFIPADCNSGHVHVVLFPAPGVVVISPPDTAVVPGQAFSLRVVTGSVADLKGFKVIFGFDPTLIQLTGASGGELLTNAPGGYSGFLVTDAAPHDSAEYDAAVLGGNASGPGVLAYFHFTALAQGTSPITCRLVDLRDSQNQPVSTACVPGQVRVVSPTGVPSNPGIATFLGAPRPNPFRGRTAVEYSLSQSGNARLEVIAADGRRIRELSDGWQGVGQHRAEWDGRYQDGNESPAGVYFIRMTFAGRVLTARIARLR